MVAASDARLFSDTTSGSVAVPPVNVPMPTPPYSTSFPETPILPAAVPLFLVLSNVRVATMEPRVYDYSFDRYGVDVVTRMDRTQLSAAARDLVRYFQDDRPALATRVVIEGQEQPLFNQRETVHMQDVKTLFGYVFLAHQIALAYLLAYIAAVFLPDGATLERTDKVVADVAAFKRLYTDAVSVATQLWDCAHVEGKTDPNAAHTIVDSLAEEPE